MNLEGFEQGDIRQRVKFAWIPTNVNGKIIWFRNYLVTEIFHFTQVTGNKGKWSAMNKTINYHR